MPQRPQESKEGRNKKLSILLGGILALGSVELFGTSIKNSSSAETNDTAGETLKRDVENEATQMTLEQKERVRDTLRVISEGLSEKKEVDKLRFELFRTLTQQLKNKESLHRWVEDNTILFPERFTAEEIEERYKRYEEWMSNYSVEENNEGQIVLSLEKMPVFNIQIDANAVVSVETLGESDRAEGGRRMGIRTLMDGDRPMDIGRAVSEIMKATHLEAILWYTELPG